MRGWLRPRPSSATSRSSHPSICPGIDPSSTPSFTSSRPSPLTRSTRSSPSSTFNPAIVSKPLPEKPLIRVWYQDVAHCDCLLGRLAAEDGQFDVAAAHLEKAEAPFRRGGAVRDLLSVLLAKADLGLRRGDWEAGLAVAEEALRLAAQRGFRLVQADALVLRGRLILSQAVSEAEATLRQAAFRASDDGEAALTLARDCGYACAERDAWELLAETRGLTGDTSGAALARREAETLTRRLSDITPPDPNPFTWVYEALQARKRG